MTPDEIKTLREFLPELMRGPEWIYGGMIGDPGKPLAHFIKAEAKVICLSMEFEVDYAGGDMLFRAIAALRNHAPELIRRAERLDVVCGDLVSCHARAINAERDVDSLRAQLAEAREVLRDNEWASQYCSNHCHRTTREYHDEPHCSECELSKSHGHAEDCRWAAMLGEG